MYKKVVERLQNIPEIVECHFTTGSYTMLIKLYAAAVKYPDAYYVCAVGSAKIRNRIIKKIKSIADVKYATLIDPAAVFGKDRVQIGEGCIICANTYITLDIKIGNHVYIGANSTVGHDSRIDDFVTVYPGANVSGSTYLGSGCEIGTGSKVIQGLSIGMNSIIGRSEERRVGKECRSRWSPYH